MKCPICDKKVERLEQYPTKEGIKQRCKNCMEKSFMEDLERNGMKLVKGFSWKKGE